MVSNSIPTVASPEIEDEYEDDEDNNEYDPFPYDAFDIRDVDNNLVCLGTAFSMERGTTHPVEITIENSPTSTETMDTSSSALVDVWTPLARERLVAFCSEHGVDFETLMAASSNPKMHIGHSETHFYGLYTQRVPRSVFASVVT